jgi:hypothetical protein
VSIFIPPAPQSRSEHPFSYLAPEVLTLVVEAVRVGADVAMIEQWEPGEG